MSPWGPALQRTLEARGTLSPQHTPVWSVLKILTPPSTWRPASSTAQDAREAVATATHLSAPCSQAWVWAPWVLAGTACGSARSSAGRPGRAPATLHFRAPPVDSPVSSRGGPPHTWSGTPLCSWGRRAPGCHPGAVRAPACGLTGHRPRGQRYSCPLLHLHPLGDPSASCQHPIAGFTGWRQALKASLSTAASSAG